MQAAEAAAATNGTKAANDNDKAKPDAPEVSNAAPEVLQEVNTDTSTKLSLTIETAAPEQIDAPETVAPAPRGAPQAAPASDTTTASVTKRVRVPPGGFSSKLW